MANYIVFKNNTNIIYILPNLFYQFLKYIFFARAAN